MIEAQLTIALDHGLHTRVAMHVTKAAKRFASQITLRYKNKTADAKDILQVMTLGAAQGAELTIEVDGDDEADALSTLQEVFSQELEV